MKNGESSGLSGSTLNYVIKGYSLFNFPMLYTFCCLTKFWIFNSMSVIPMKFPVALHSRYF